MEGGKERILGDDGGNGGNDGREMAEEGGGSGGDGGNDGEVMEGGGGREGGRKDEGGGVFRYVLFNGMEFLSVINLRIICEWQVGGEWAAEWAGTCVLSL